MIIFDAHLDLAWNALDWNRNLQLPCEEIRQLEKSSGDNEKGRGANTVSFPDLRRGKVVIFVATVLARLFRPGSIPPIQLYSQTESAFGAAMGQLHYYRGMEQEGRLRLIKDWPSLEAHVGAWKADEDSRTLPLGCILSMEGADAILRPDQVQEWWDAGLRIIGPCLYGVSPYGHGTARKADSSLPVDSSSGKWNVSAWFSMPRISRISVSTKPWTSSAARCSPVITTIARWCRISVSSPTSKPRRLSPAAASSVTR